MALRSKFIGICAVSGLCIILLTIEQYRLTADNLFLAGLFTQKITINQIIELQRTKILQEMENFEYPSGRFGSDAETLADLTPETGGKPIRSIIISTWRSGSSFLGEILDAVPGNYYHFEPLQPFRCIQIRGPPNDTIAIRKLKKLLNCDYNDMDDHLEFGKKYKRLFHNSPRLWMQCKKYPKFCFEPKFLIPFCKLFPLQSMKLTRLRLGLAEQLLDDASLNVRIILLVRDPRGTMQSRNGAPFCFDNVDCSNVSYLCSDLVSDYYAADILKKKYPTRFRVVRYEELSINPYNMSKAVLQFYGLPLDDMVKRYLDTHTKENSGNRFSTLRDSKSAPFHWIKDLRWYEIQNIENNCSEAMDLWGYRKMNSPKDQDEAFEPVLPATFT